MIGVAAVCVLCCACGAPSLRYKKEVNKLVSAGQWAEAAAKVEASKTKNYSERDRLLYYLDESVLHHEAGAHVESDQLLAQAQQRTDELFARSISGQAGRLLINDLTLSYYPADYETALTYYYRAMNFLQQQDVSSAQVEARKAVFFLDNLRNSKPKGYNDDPFVQYFSSLVFESAGNLNDARVSRARATLAYQKGLGGEGTAAPAFAVPQNADRLGEIIVIHSNGFIPLKQSSTFQVQWGQAMAWASAPQEGEDVAPEVQNALTAGLTGNALTLSWPTLQPQPYQIRASRVEAGGQTQRTVLMSNVADLADTDLKAKLPGIWFRSATRAVVKRIAAEQAKKAMNANSEDPWAGELAGMLVSAFGAMTEKADTRQWFTLPAEIRMSRLFVRPGTQQVTLRFEDEFGNIVGEHVFDNVYVKPGGRVFLHYRTAR